eukprot:CAMPEP_0202965266 /NCGR_PEP_ID=MMETSP1396-20130829/9299_1 /ASSEMBLY_ACC=CAM_ASM_000872 /TAXON_ID= /ORGANISM="Pseudokeronopsis sp., Strain Brazil" /LENGTH=40 /DNA_ID= /DNA_START= /DNA_END= /DNA_ORIENTATION=
MTGHLFNPKLQLLGDTAQGETSASKKQEGVTFNQLLSKTG